MKTDSILWVDDEIDLLKPYVIYLEDKGYTVQTATTQECTVTNLDNTVGNLDALQTAAQIEGILINRRQMIR